MLIIISGLSLLFIFNLQHVLYCSPSVVPGYLDFDNLPDTNFSCEGKVIGGYYADVETGCQMFHVCTIGQKGEITDIKFLCLNGTVFDQETRVCERVDEVDCSKTEGFYDLNLELYGNNAALSFPEEESNEDESETQSNAETSDSSSQTPSSKHKTSTLKPVTTPSTSSTPRIPHPASTTTLKTPIHPFIPTTTVPSYKPNQHITHFHSSTPPSIAAFLAINNAFSSSNTNQEGNKFSDTSSQYDDEEDEELEEDDDSITDHPGISLNSGTNHHFPITTIGNPIRPNSPEQHHILHPNVKVQGTGESGLILNQPNRQQQQQQVFQSQKSPILNPPTSTQSTHIYGHSYHPTSSNVKNANVHSKHQLNTQLILNQQRDDVNKQHHGFKPITNPDNRNQFLFSSTTQQPPVFFTTKSSNGFSTTINSPTVEPFSLHAIGPQPPIQTTQQSSNNSPFPPQTNAHQVPPNPLVQQIRNNIANNGGFITQTIHLSQNPLTFQFNSNNNNRQQGHQLFTTPSIAVIATTSSTSSSSSIRSSPVSKIGNISPEISLRSSIGSTPKGSSTGITNNSSASLQLFSDTTPPNSYDEYQEADVSSDPFFRDVPKLPKLSTQLKGPPPRHGVKRKRREVSKKGYLTVVNAKRNHPIMRYKRKAVAQVGLPTEIFGTDGVRYRNRPGGPTRSYAEEQSHHESNSRGRTRSRPQSGTVPSEELGLSPRQLTSSAGERSHFHARKPVVTTTIPEVPQQSPDYSSFISSTPLAQSLPKHVESAIIEPPIRTNVRQGHRRTVVKVKRPHSDNSGHTESDKLISIARRPDEHVGSSGPIVENSRLEVRYETTTVPIQMVSISSKSKENSYEIPTESSRISVENSDIQDFTRHTPSPRIHDRVGHRQSEHNLARSNLEQRPSVDNSSETPRLRSRQRTRVKVSDTSHRTNDHVSRSGATSRHRSDSDSVRLSNRRIDNEYADSVNIGARSTYRPHAQTATLNRGRNSGVSSQSREVTRSNVSDLKPASDETNPRSGVTSELMPEFSSQPPPPLPETNFTCADKIPGGYYADLEADCQLFHICSLGRHGRIQDNKFFCGPGTRFNQRSRTCQVRDSVDCSLSGSLYYLNSHFKLEPQDELSKDNIKFEPQKIRSKRKAPKGTSSAEDGPQPRYSIDNIPETSFTCEDKPQDGLYADVETQCQVFHLCRTISGVLTLESSFVCPSGTVFNQPEGNCDTWKEVDCALYSAPQHSFRKTSSGSRTQGSKVRNKRHIEKNKTRKKKLVKLQKKKFQEKHSIHKTYRVKRDTPSRSGAIDYYDYVDDNYEAHISKPVNKYATSDKNEPTYSDANRPIANVDEYVYDYYPDSVSSRKDVEEESHQIEKHENGKDIQEDPSSHLKIKDSVTHNKTVDYYESADVPMTHSEENSTVSPEIPSQNNSDKRKVVDDSDYEYVYEYDDITTAVSNQKLIDDIKPTIQVQDFNNNSNNSTLLEAAYKDENSVGLTSEFSSVVDDVTDPIVTENIQNITSSVKSIEDQTVETTPSSKPVSPTTKATSDEYEYEYYYDDDYTDKANETKIPSDNSNNLSSPKSKLPVDVGPTGSTLVTNTDQELYHSTEEMVKDDNQQKTNASTAKIETVLNETQIDFTTEHFRKPEDQLKNSLKSTEKEQKNLEVGVIENTQKSKYSPAELFETHTTPTFLQELDGKSVSTGAAVQPEDNSYVKEDDDVTLTSLTTQFQKKLFAAFGMETTTLYSFTEENNSKDSDLNSSSHVVDISDSKPTSKTTELPVPTTFGVTDYYATIATTAESQEGSTTPLYDTDTTSFATVTPHLQREETLKQAVTSVTDHLSYSDSVTPPIVEQTTTEEITILTSSTTTPYPSSTATKVRNEKPTFLKHSTTTSAPSSSIPSLFRPSKSRNVYRSRYSTPVLPPVVIQPREMSRKPTLRRNRHRDRSNYNGNHLSDNELRGRNSHKFTVQPDEKPVTDTPRPVHLRRRTTTVATTIVANDPIIIDQEASSQNTVPSIQSSEGSKYEDSTLSYFNSYDELKTVLPHPFTKSSEISANAIFYANNEPLHSTSLPVDTTGTLLSAPPPSHNSIPTSTPQHDQTFHTQSIPVYPSILKNNISSSNHSLPDVLSVEKDFRLSTGKPTTSLVFSTNDLVTPVPITTTTAAEFLSSTSPPSHFGYTLSSVSSQPSVSISNYGNGNSGFVCTGKELYHYHPDPDDCRMFHYCSPGFHNRQVLDFRFTCENGTAFKSETQKCENESLVTSCASVKGQKVV